MFQFKGSKEFKRKRYLTSLSQTVKTYKCTKQLSSIYFEKKKQINTPLVLKSG